MRPDFSFKNGALLGEAMRQREGGVVFLRPRTCFVVVLDVIICAHEVQKHSRRGTNNTTGMFLHRKNQQHGNVSTPGCGCKIAGSSSSRLVPVTGYGCFFWNS